MEPRPTTWLGARFTVSAGNGFAVDDGIRTSTLPPTEYGKRAVAGSADRATFVASGEPTGFSRCSIQYLYPTVTPYVIGNPAYRTTLSEFLIAWVQ